MSLSPIEVELALDPADSARVSRATSPTWSSRCAIPPVVSGYRVARLPVAVFDAVPPGTYTVLVDASASSEPLRPVGDNPAVVIAGGRAVAPIRIVMRARALRFSNQRRNEP